MKGLILKDLYTLRNQGKVIAALGVFYILFGMFTNNLSMFNIMIVLIAVMQPITTLSYDEHYNWDRYVISMPVRRSSVVLSKYILGFGLSLITTLIVTIATIVMTKITDGTDLQTSLLTVLGFILGTNILLAFILPILFKFGVEKGRVLMLLAFGFPFLVVMVLAKLGFTLPSDEILTNLFYLSVPLVIGIFALSILISITIYNRKEL